MNLCFYCLFHSNSVKHKQIKKCQSVGRKQSANYSELGLLIKRGQSFVTMFNEMVVPGSDKCLTGIVILMI